MNRHENEPALLQEVVKQVMALLAGGQAHADLDRAIGDFPPDLRGSRPDRVPYSAWQLLEHLRITQADILAFITNGDGAGYKELKWPEAYWPEASAPPNPMAWDDAVHTIRREQEKLVALCTASDADLVTPFPWGGGQTLLREALLLADHNAYHLGELVLLRRLLGAWSV